MTDCEEKMKVHSEELRIKWFHDCGKFSRLVLKVCTWHPQSCYTFWKSITKWFPHFWKMNSFKTLMQNKWADWYLVLKVGCILHCFNKRKCFYQHVLRKFRSIAVYHERKRVEKWISKTLWSKIFRPLDW